MIQIQRGHLSTNCRGISRRSAIKVGFSTIGIDPTQAFADHTGRPVPILDQGEVIKELI